MDIQEQGSGNDLLPAVVLHLWDVPESPWEVVKYRFWSVAPQSGFWVCMLEKPYWPLGDRTETCTCEMVYKSLTATRVTSCKWGQRAQGQQSRGVRWAGLSSLYWGQGFASLFFSISTFSYLGGPSMCICSYLSTSFLSNGGNGGKGGFYVVLLVLVLS